MRTRKRLQNLRMIVRYKCNPSVVDCEEMTAIARPIAGLPHATSPVEVEPKPLKLVHLILILDLAFVRNHLSLVEGKLRDRGQNPDEVLKDFHQVDQRRRSHVQSLEAV